MRPVSFEGHNVVYAAKQSEYMPLPAHVSYSGVATTCWQFSWRERLRVLFSGCVWWQQLTFGMRLQPVCPTVEKPVLQKGKELASRSDPN